MGKRHTYYQNPWAKIYCLSATSAPHSCAVTKEERHEWNWGGGKYWVLYNYIRASKVFHCNETITLTTHGTYSYMKNLYPLLKRWQGPVSIAVFAPGHDHSQTVDTIMFFRNCLEKGHSTYVRELVTFHIFFPKSHLPPLVFMTNETYDFSLINSIIPQEIVAMHQIWLNNYKPNCSRYSHKDSYKKQENIFYPVNVARNIARETATTHYVFPSDIELYPRPGLIPDFLNMIGRNEPALRSHKPKVFVNPIFEIKQGFALPLKKIQLLEYMLLGIVVPFHQDFCKKCHKIPDFKMWIKGDLNSSKSTLCLVFDVILVQYHTPARHILENMPPKGKPLCPQWAT